MSGPKVGPNRRGRAMSFPSLGSLKLDRLLEGLLSGRVDNYVIPGLRSGIVTSQGSRIRLFHQTAHQAQAIIPHSHRFDLLSIVLAGRVRNTIWQPVWKIHGGHSQGDQNAMARRTMVYDGEMGKYSIGNGGKDEMWAFSKSTSKYNEGSSYYMRHDEIHSIEFGAGTVVLLIESPQRSDSNDILLPLDSDGNVIECFKTEPWMFKKYED